MHVCLQSRLRRWAPALSLSASRLLWHATHMTTQKESSVISLPPDRTLSPPSPLPPAIPPLPSCPHYFLFSVHTPSFILINAGLLYNQSAGLCCLIAIAACKDLKIMSLFQACYYESHFKLQWYCATVSTLLFCYSCSDELWRTSRRAKCIVLWWKQKIGKIRGK